jgi:magnesium transporter
VDPEVLTILKTKHNIQDNFLNIITTENLYSLIEQYNEQSFLIIALPIYNTVEKIINTIEVDIIITKEHIILSTDHQYEFIENTCTTQYHHNDRGIIIHNIIQTFCIHVLDSIKHLEHEIAISKHTILYEKSITKDVIESIMATKMSIGILRSTIDPFVDIINHIQEVTLSWATNKINTDQIDHYIKQIQSQSKFIYETITIIADSVDALQTINTNNIMKVLAIISTIFIPLSFVTGVFGMNFEHMPWLDWIWWYYITMWSMLFIWLFQLYVFKKRKRF